MTGGPPDKVHQQIFSERSLPMPRGQLGHVCPVCTGIPGFRICGASPFNEHPASPSPEQLTVCNRSATWLVTLPCVGVQQSPDRGLAIRVGPLSQVVWRSEPALL